MHAKHILLEKLASRAGETPTSEAWSTKRGPGRQNKSLYFQGNRYIFFQLEFRGDQTGSLLGSQGSKVPDYLRETPVGAQKLRKLYVFYYFLAPCVARAMPY